MSRLLKAITPINLQEEKIKFFDSKSYNPQFRYLWFNPKYKNEDNSSYYGNLIRAIYKQDQELIIKEAEIVFETQIDEDYIKKCNRILASKIVPHSYPTTADLIKELSDLLKLLNLNYEVRTTFKDGFNVRPQPSKQKVFVSSQSNFEFLQPKGEAIHEISHIIRYENTKFNKIDKSINFLPTDEGLACLVQDLNPESGKYSYYEHAAEYMATQIALKGSLRDVYKFFTSIGFSEELAWLRSTRHKFGLIDSSKPFDIMKPAMYFHHEERIRQNSPEDILRLYIGRISLDDIDDYEKYTGKFDKSILQKLFSIRVL